MDTPRFSQSEARRMYEALHYISTHPIVATITGAKSAAADALRSVNRRLAADGFDKLNITNWILGRR